VTVTITEIATVTIILIDTLIVNIIVNVTVTLNAHDNMIVYVFFTIPLIKGHRKIIDQSNGQSNGHDNINGHGHGHGHGNGNGNGNGNGHGHGMVTARND
jgi:hypothetical protein